MKYISKKHIIISIIAAFAIFAFITKNNNKGIAVDIAYPQRKTIVEMIPANGKIRPVTEVKITPDVSGEIIELNVKEGDKVRKG